MKSLKLILLTIFFLCTTSIIAQLKVDATGRTVFGNTYRTYNDGISITDLATSSGSGFTPFRISRLANDYVYMTRGSSNRIGFMMNLYGLIGIGNNLPTSLNSPGTVQIFADSYGGLVVNLTGSSGEGVKSKVSDSYSFPFVGYYNNTKVFYVNSNGQTYSNGSLLTSDISLKSNIEPIGNALEKVMQLRGVVYDMNFPKTKETTVNFEAVFNDAQVITPGITRETLKQIMEERNRKRMGVIAQEVEKIVPEVVRTREDGLKAVSYAELTGLLIEALKEQQSEIDELKMQVEGLKEKQGSNNAPAQNTAEGSLPSKGINLNQQCVLSQNAPNPFSQQTEIRYFVVDEAKEAYIFIFDMQGKMLEKLGVKQGQNSLFIEGSKLQPGMYMYTLVVDGMQIDTKRMILTK